MQQPNDQQEGQKQGVPSQQDDNQPTEYEHPCRGVVPPGGLPDEDE